MKQNLFLFILIIFLAISGFLIYFQKNYISLSSQPKNTSSLNESQKTDASLEFNVYFNNNQLNPNLDDCSIVYPVKRKISISGDPFVQVLNLLFLGPTANEINQGYTSVFSAKTKNILKNFDIDQNGVAYVDFYDFRDILPEVSSSCGSAQFIKSIEETLKQFKVINKVIFAINGDPQIFYDWVGLGCQQENNFCDKTPFLKFYQENQ